MYKTGGLQLTCTIVLFAEAGQSLITEAMESSEYEDSVDDFVWDDLLIDEDEDNDINWQTRSR